MEEGKGLFDPTAPTPRRNVLGFDSPPSPPFISCRQNPPRPKTRVATAKTLQPAPCALPTPTTRARTMPTSHHHTKCSCRRQRPCQPVLGVSCPTTRLRARLPRLPWNRFFVSDLRPVHHQLAPASSPSHPFHAMLYCAFYNACDSSPCHAFPCSAYSLPCALLCFLCHVAVCACTPLLTPG